MSKGQWAVIIALIIGVLGVFGCLVPYLLVDMAGGVPSHLQVSIQPFDTGPELGARIAFTAWEQDDLAHEVYVMNADGSRLTNLTNHPSDDTEPSCSPDGGRIAFVSYRDGNGDIYVINTDGSGLFQVTHTSGEISCGSPSWSPDGTRIAFNSNLQDLENEDIYIINADSTGLTRLTTDPGEDQYPAWSPDGQRIAFDSSRGENITDLYLMNIDGTGLVQLTDTAHNWDGAPAWSPDGMRIAFFRMSGWPDGWQDADIYVINADATGLAQVTAGSDWDFGPSWSPDGGMIVFSFRPDQSLTYHIGMVNLDGTGRVSLSSLADSDAPSWCSDADVSGTELNEHTQPDDTAYSEYMSCSGEVMGGVKEDVSIWMDLALALLASDSTDMPGFCAELPKWSTQISESRDAHSECSVPESKYLQEHWRLRDKSLQEYSLAIECYEGYCASLAASDMQECADHLDRALDYLNQADEVMRQYLASVHHGE